jgi:hypothetical protein
MTDWPEGVLAAPTHIHTLSRFAAGGLGRGLIAMSGVAAATWVSGLAVYIPFHLPFPYVVRRVMWQNGSTITTTNVDCGVYTAAGTKLFSSGSTAMVGVSARQYVSVAETLLMPGAYYLAWTCDGTTNRATANVLAAQEGEMLGLQQQSAALPLPAAMTEVAYAGAGLPFCGITRTASGF